MILLRRLAVTGTTLLAVALGGAFSATQAFAAPATTSGHAPSITTTAATHDSDATQVRTAQLRTDSIEPAGTNAAATGTRWLRYQSSTTAYSTLYWDYCWSDATQTAYIYLEMASSNCGSEWTAHVWGWGSVTNASQLEVCHSADHSGTSTLWDVDLNGTHSLSDVAGGGCGLATRSAVNDFELSWGGETSPSWRAYLAWPWVNTISAS